MQPYKVLGIVIRRTRFKGSSRFFTILTAEGKLSAIGHQTGRYKSPLSGCEIFGFFEFVLEEKGQYRYIKSTDSIKRFDGIGKSLERMALAVYFCDLLDASAMEGTDTADLLKLVLNTFHLLDTGFDLSILKPVFELRLIALLGFAPDLTDVPFRKLPPAALQAASYILAAEENKMVAFSIREDVLFELTKTAEEYTLRRMERSFSSLDYYKRL